MRLLVLLALVALCRADVGRTVYFVRHGVRLPFVPPVALISDPPPVPLRRRS